ncbi:polysaccharide deacetylase family protein [Mucilaginibacter boryungensis]|uniref:Polysaccharide deacetylase family protein n=1 Tax=Mucilaginibacter boryungensis TaxID=768480 RepID=A0ABR9XHB2_9SPHI|nr:polysaccharide deacetylase family protein [Mucilaginibacter boryungensis]MBE9666388.1 polysaccharide deacetylase family protein [Mucilaginibacter boryungensis]
MKIIAYILLVMFGCCMYAQAQGIKKPIPDKLVVLTFDDAVLSHYTNVAPLLKKYGFTATFFVCEFGGKPDFSDKTKYMSWEQVAELSKMGFEIGNHTWHHTHVNKIIDEKLNSELSYIEQKFDEYHIPKPVSFAYPGYDTSRRAIEVLKKKGYKFARGGWDRVYDPKTDEPMLMPGYTTHSEKADAAYDILKQAKGGKIAVLTIHGVPDDAHPWVTTSVEIFEGYLKFLKENHYKVIAMRDLNKYVVTN